MFQIIPSLAEARGSWLNAECMSTGLLEREDVMSRAEAALERAQSGHGSLLVIEGRAGMGKTAVLAAVRETAAARGLRVLRGRGAQLEREFGFGVVRQLVEPAMMAMSPPERAALLQGPAELAGRVLGLPGANGIAPPDGDPSFALLHGLYWLLAGMASERPALLVVDDGQWADAASLRYLAFLATRLEDLPAALIVATRPFFFNDTATTAIYTLSLHERSR